MAEITEAAVADWLQRHPEYLEPPATTDYSQQVVERVEGVKASLDGAVYKLPSGTYEIYIELVGPTRVCLKRVVGYPTQEAAEAAMAAEFAAIHERVEKELKIGY